MHTDDRRTVSGCFLFADHGLTEAAEAILDRCPIRSYRKGELIYSRDCFERAVGVLLSGEAEVLKGRGVVLNTLSAGDSFGVAGLFTENDRYVSDIRAVRPCRVLLLSAPALEQLFAADNAAALGYIRFLSGRICFLNQKLDAFTSSSAEGRIVVWLLENMDDSRVVIPRGYQPYPGHWQGFALPVSGRSGSPGRSAAPGAGDRDPASGAIAEPHRLTIVSIPVFYGNIP